MSIYRRDEVFPEWEPVPWQLDAEKADEQEREFHARATSPITWIPIPFNDFPDEGIFGESKDWLSNIEASFFATFGREDLLLIDNSWNGFPDPPRWGLISRPSDQSDAKWSHWGHFPDLPAQWDVSSTPT